MLSKMKTVYLVLAHKNIKQIERLITALTSHDGYCFVHVDKKSEDLYRHLKQKYEDEESIYIVQRRIIVNWGGLSQVRAILVLMHAVRESGIEFGYLHLLSGQDFPIRPLKEIDQFFSENSPAEFIECMPIGHYRWRIKNYNFFTEFRSNRTLPIRIVDNILRRIQKTFPERNTLKGRDLYKGSSWFSLTYECMIYILEYLNEDPDFLNDFSHSSNADEHFFQILLMNSPFKGKVVNNNLRFIDWEEGKSSPRTLRVKDFKTLQNSFDLFARKFDSNIDGSVLKLLERKINV